MDVAQWADVSAVVSAGVVRCRLVHACNARETWPLALTTRETCVKPWRCPPKQQPRPQRRDLATSSNNTTPQPRGVSRKPCPGLVRGYEAG